MNPLFFLAGIIMGSRPLPPTEPHWPDVPLDRRAIRESLRRSAPMPPPHVDLDDDLRAEELKDAQARDEAARIAEEIERIPPA